MIGLSQWDSESGDPAVSTQALEPSIKEALEGAEQGERTALLLSQHHLNCLIIGMLACRAGFCSISYLSYFFFFLPQGRANLPMIKDYSPLNAPGLLLMMLRGIYWCQGLN